MRYDFIPPVASVANGQLPPAAKSAVVGILMRPRSAQYAVLVDAGRCSNLSPDALTAAPAMPVPQSAALGLNIVRAQRTAVGFMGFKRRAGLGLYKPHPEGMPEPSAYTYLQTDEFKYDIARIVRDTALASGSTMEALRNQEYKVRVDVEYLMKPSADDTVVRAEQTVDAPDGEDRIVPYIFSSERFTRGFPMKGTILGNNGSFSASLLLFTVDLQGHLLEFISRAFTKEGSQYAFDSLIASFAWVTPTSAAAAHGGVAQKGVVLQTRGLLPDNKDKKDSMCIARSIITALDPQLHAQLGTSLFALRSAYLEGAESDLAKHTAKGSPEVDKMRLRLDAARTAFDRACSVTRELGITIPEKGKSVRTHARFPSIEAALRVALEDGAASVKRGNPDLTHAFFRGRQPITEATVAFMRSVLAAVKVKVNFWYRVDSGNIAVQFHDEGATLAYLEGGGRIINLLCADEHVSAMTSVTSLCFAVAGSSQRKYCDLCGFAAPHTTPRSPFQTRTLLFNHAERGCTASSDTPLTFPLSRQNVRQLDARSFAACFDTGVHLTMSVDSNHMLAVSGTVATPWGDRFLPGVGCEEQLSVFLARWGRVGRSVADFSVIEAQLPLQSPPVLLVANDPAFGGGADAALNAVSTALHHLLCPSFASLLFMAAGVHFPTRSTTSASVDAERGPCFFCRAPVGGPSRDDRLRAAAAALSTEAAGTYEEACDDDDASSEIDPTEDMPVCESDATTGLPVMCHKSCADSVRRRRSARVTAFIDVAEQTSMNLLLEAVAQRAFLDSVCKGAVPQIIRNGRHVRSFSIEVPLAYHDGSKRSRDGIGRLVLCVKFRGPIAFGASDTWKPAMIGAQERAVAYGLDLRAWSRLERESTRLCPLYFETAVSYSRAALLHTVSVPTPPPTSICSQDGLRFVDRLTKGGRLFTGCAVVHPPVTCEDRRVVRLTLDFTAKYPDVVKRWPMPHQEHTLSLLHDFSTDVAAGVKFVQTADVTDAAQPVCCVEVSGAFPDALHQSLLRFPPLFSRIAVPVTAYTPFQRMRLRMALSDAPTDRTVPHLFPLDNEVVCLREAAMLHRLGFVFSHIGQVWGCKGSMWAQPFMAAAEERRRKAAREGCAAGVAAVKLLTNSVLGAMNMNLSRRFDLKVVMTHDVSFQRCIETGQEPVPEGDSRAGRRSVRLADDPRFTGRVFTAGDLTLVEMLPKPEPHVQMTFFALLVQAYARCDHVEFMYGTDKRPGLLDAFPDARVLYANTDSVTVELCAHSWDESQDARVLLWRRMHHWLDLSNVPLTSTFWAGLGEHERAAAQATAAIRSGVWGFVKEETGFAGIGPFVVNGPNRYAYRVLQSSTDTLPSQRVKTDVLKNLPAAWASCGTTVEQYAADWCGGHTEEEVAALEAAAPPGVPAPVYGTSLWGNASVITARSGAQWPLGTAAKADPQLEAALEDKSL